MRHIHLLSLLALSAFTCANAFAGLNVTQGESAVQPEAPLVLHKQVIPPPNPGTFSLNPSKSDILLKIEAQRRADVALWGAPSKPGTAPSLTPGQVPLGTPLPPRTAPTEAPAILPASAFPQPSSITPVASSMPAAPPPPVFQTMKQAADARPISEARPHAGFDAGAAEATSLAQKALELIKAHQKEAMLVASVVLLLLTWVLRRRRQHLHDSES